MEGVVTSTFANFVLNKKLGCIIQNCSLGGCVPRWFCGVSSRVDVGRFIGSVASIGEMSGGSSVGFYVCVGGAFLLQSLAG